MYAYYYLGPPINEAGPLVATDVALRQMFDWFDANGGTNRTPWLHRAAGREHQDSADRSIRRTCGNSPSASAAGSASRGVVRADFVRRMFRDFYADRDGHDDRDRHE